MGQRVYSEKQLLSQRARALMDALHSEGWIPFWRETAQRMAPRTGRFLAGATDRGRSGQIRHNYILDNCAVDASNTLAAGFVSGAASPARPWFKSTTADPDLSRYQPVREWFDRVDEIIRDVLAASNFYRATFEDFRGLGVFGQSCGMLMADDERVLHQYPFAIGEYAWATDGRDEVQTCVRKMALTTSQMVSEFGWEKVSGPVRDAWNRGHLDHWWTVWHAIEPNSDRDHNSRGAAGMAWRSCYWEETTQGREGYLREGGFRRFPIIAPRWSVEPGETYGFGPGAFAFGDVGQLQHQQLRKGQVLDFGTAPPLQGPPLRKDDEINFLPSGYTTVDQPGTQPIKPIWQPTVPFHEITTDIQDVRQRIQRAFHVDMFLMLAATNDVQKTAREIAERSEERLLQIGPVVARVNNDKLEPTLRMAFETCLERGLLPPAPEELDGQEWRIQFTSIFSQAQKLVGVATVERFIGTINVLAGQNREVLQKVNYDEVVDAYSDMLGVPARMIIATDKAMALREAQNQAMAAKEQSAMMAEQAGAIQKLASSPTGGGNALDLMGQLAGYGNPAAAV